MTTCHFQTKMSHFSQLIIFSGKSLISSMYLLAPFIIQNLKKILRVDSKLWGLAIFRSKMALFRKHINKICHVHSCLSTCNKSESDVNPLTRYWRLKNTEIWLVESIFGHNLRIIFFPHMRFLQNAKGS